MGDRFSWRRLLRLRCRAIASASPLPGDEHGNKGIALHLCARLRFHRGPCEA